MKAVPRRGRGISGRPPGPAQGSSGEVAKILAAQQTKLKSHIKKAKQAAPRAESGGASQSPTRAAAQESRGERRERAMGARSSKARNSKFRSSSYRGGRSRGLATSATLARRSRVAARQRPMDAGERQRPRRRQRRRQGQGRRQRGVGKGITSGDVVQ